MFINVLVIKSHIKRYILDKIQKFVLHLYKSFYVKNVIPTYYYTEQKRKGKVLISYLPVHQLAKLTHTNILECNAIAEEIRSFGYDIDLYSCSDNVNKLSSDKYELIFGFGQPFRFASANKKTNTKSILYCTEGPLSLASEKEIEAFKRVRKTLGINNFVRRSKKIYQDSDFLIPDKLLVLGDDTSRWSTFELPVDSIDPTGLPPRLDINHIRNKKFNKSLLWLGSYGAVNRGLDLAFLAASNLNLELHVVGVKHKKDKLLLSKLQETYPLVQSYDYGFISLYSDTFKSVLKLSSALILPSASEGVNTGLLTSCRNGIPGFVSSNCGISKSRIGITVCDNFQDMLSKLYSYYNYHDNEYYINNSINVFNESNNKYNIISFRKKFNKYISNLLI